jgi:predicted GIY-YIG superfamily endonuclease
MGWIYLLYDEAGKGYIGQTRNIKQRLFGHKNKGNKTCSKYLGEWQCEILEEVEDDCLEDFERYWYDFYNELFPGMLVNKCQPLLSRKESHKKWRENNSENISKYQKKYREENLENVRKKQLENTKRYRLNKKLKNLSLEV